MSHKWRYTTGNRVDESFNHLFTDDQVCCYQKPNLLWKNVIVHKTMLIQDNLRELELELSWDMISMRFKTNWLLMF